MSMIPMQSAKFSAGRLNSTTESNNTFMSNESKRDDAKQVLTPSLVSFFFDFTFFAHTIVIEADLL